MRMLRAPLALWSMRGMASVACGVDSEHPPPLPPVPPQAFEVLHEAGTRRFTMLSTSPVTNDTVVVTCLVNHRALPKLSWDSSAAAAAKHGQCARRQGARRRAGGRIALPTYSPDVLPIRFRAYVGSERRNLCMELRLVSLDGLLGIDGVVMHPGGVVRGSVVEMPLREASQLYQGPTLNQRFLAETLTSSHRQSINPLVPYRQCLSNFTDPFFNPRVCPHSFFSHHPVHTAPDRVTDAIARFAADVGVDDDLALFVHKYAVYVQSVEDSLWLRKVDEALGGLLPSSREEQRLRRRRIAP